MSEANEDKLFLPVCPTIKLREEWKSLQNFFLVSKSERKKRKQNIWRIFEDSFKEVFHDNRTSSDLVLPYIDFCLTLWNKVAKSWFLIAKIKIQATTFQWFEKRIKFIVWVRCFSQIVWNHHLKFDLTISSNSSHQV